MAGWQQTQIVGNLGQDPEFKYTQSGIPVCNFSVAVTQRKGTGENRTEETTWFRCVAWRELAEICNEYLRKGKQVLVVGDIKPTAYIGKDGKPIGALELTVKQMVMLGSPGERQEAQGSSPNRQRGMQQNPTGSDDEPDAYVPPELADIPF